MKKILFISMLMLFISTLSYAQCSKKCKSSCDKTVAIPAAVKSNFYKAHPDAKTVVWKKEAGNFHAKYLANGTVNSTFMATDGDIVMEAVKIETSELPTEATAYLKKNHKDAIIEYVKKITKDDDIFFNVILKSGAEEIELQFDPKGNKI